MRPEQPACSAVFARATDSSVESEEMAATTGACFAAAITLRITASFSARVRVAASPSEPSVMMPVQPLASSHCTWRVVKP